MTLARACSRLLELRPGLSVALGATNDRSLADEVARFVTTSGATVADADAAESDAALVTVEGDPSRGATGAVRRTIEAVKAGGTVVVVVAQAPDDVSVEALAGRLAPRFDLTSGHGERIGDALVVRGRRRARLTNTDLKRLRGMAHDIEPTVLVGRSGLSGDIVDAVLSAVERHGLIKVKLTPQATLDKNQAAADLAWASGSQLVQRVGKTAILYRPDVPLAPPVKRRKGRRRS